MECPSHPEVHINPTQSALSLAFCAVKAPLAAVSLTRQFGPRLFNVWQMSCKFTLCPEYIEDES